MNVPASTYRLQLHEGFTFDDAASVAPYLKGLGVTHLYLSPIFRAAPGSEHGYDVVDANAIDEARGGRVGFDRLRASCLELGMGLVLDIVPNHMDISGPTNRYFWNVLRTGRRSQSSAIFDIDWHDPDAEGRVILPVLGRTQGEEIDDGAISLTMHERGPSMRYHEHLWPLRPMTVASVLDRAANAGEAIEGRELSAELQACEDGDLDESHLDTLMRRVGAMCDESVSTKRAVEDALAHFSEPGRLRSVLADQHYTPMQWEAGSEVVNYRRFFDIDTLIGVRIEDKDVFEETHRLIIELVGLEGVAGLRVDHPDGLRDPKGYFHRLASRTPGTWIVAEKILARDEELPSGWSVAGTSGYDFLNDAVGVLIEPESEAEFTGVYAEIASDARPFHITEISSKRLAATDLLASDLRRLVRTGERAVEGIDRDMLREMLIEFATYLPVYRIYSGHGEPESEEDRARLEHAIANALPGTHLEEEQVRRVASVLLDPGDSASAMEFAARFQQYTAPATAKGVEDTAFYRDTRFVALNEVGGDPSRFGMGVDEYHERVRSRHIRWPHAMTTTSTHDTKRSEDVRARLAVLSTMPGQWGRWNRRWVEIVDSSGRGRLLGEDLTMLLQTLVGAWPIARDRVNTYMTKALREAKRSTRWRDVDEPYEEAMLALTERLYDDSDAIELIEEIVGLTLTPGRINSLAQTVLRLASPGVPDTYRGCELWDLSLVDPDNRRPVDYGERERLLRALDTMTMNEIWSSIDDPNDPGVAKLWTARTLLRLRRDHPDVFSGDGMYDPVRIMGDGADRFIAFARGARGEAMSMVVIVPTRGDTRGRSCEVVLPEMKQSRLMNLCDGTEVDSERVGMADLFAVAPVALLIDPEIHA